MDVSVPLMRRLALVMSIAACSDDLAMSVRVEHPEGAQIERTEVTVYESPAGDVSCADIEFQDITEAELAGLEVARVDGSGSLDGISRVGTKLVVARGFRANGMYFTAGCAEQGTIDGEVTVVVQTSIVATVSLGGTEPGGMDLGSIPITITSPLGAALPRRAIGWRVYSAAGATPQQTMMQLATGTDEWEPVNTTCTGTDGSIKLRPVPPAQIGGYAARVRVSWGQEPPRLFSLFTRAELVPKSLAVLGSAAQGRLCTPRTSGATTRIVCIENDGTGEPIARDLAVTVSGGAATLTVAGSQTFAAADEIAAVYTVTNGTTRDAYAITRIGRVIGLFNPSRPALPLAQQVPFVNEGLVADVMSVPVCKAEDAPRLAVRTTDIANNRQKLWIKEPHGGQFIAFANLEGSLADVYRFNAAGCVTELSTSNAQPISRQVIVVDQIDASKTPNEATSAAFYDCSNAAGRCATRLPLPFNGVGFKRGNNGEEDRLVAPLFDASGTVISELIFLDGKVVERARFSSAALPDHIVSGQFDGDAKADVLWDFSALGATQSNFQVAYAREVDGEPLTAVTGTKAVVATDMFAIDVTGDGTDDIAIVQRSRDASTPSTISVIPARAAAAPLNVRPDDMCQ